MKLVYKEDFKVMVLYSKRKEAKKKYIREERLINKTTLQRCYYYNNTTNMFPKYEKK